MSRNVPATGEVSTLGVAIRRAITARRARLVRRVVVLLDGLELGVLSTNEDVEGQQPRCIRASSRTPMR